MKRVLLAGGLLMLLVVASGIEANSTTIVSEDGPKILISREFVLHIPQSGQFLPPDLDHQLETVLEATAEYQELYAIEVIGYTDDFGGKLENLLLSIRRAGAVGERLAELGETLGIEDGLISFDGFGELHPVASNSTEEGRNSNRRIVVRLSGQKFSREPLPPVSSTTLY